MNKKKEPAMVVTSERIAVWFVLMAAIGFVTTVTVPVLAIGYLISKL